MRVVLLLLLVVVVVLPRENKVKPNCQSSVRVGWSCWLKLSVGLGLGWVLTKVLILFLDIKHD